MKLLEAKPSSSPAIVVAPLLAEKGPDIPALLEQLAIMESTGKADVADARAREPFGRC